MTVRMQWDRVVTIPGITGTLPGRVFQVLVRTLEARVKRLLVRLVCFCVTWFTGLRSITLWADQFFLATTLILEHHSTDLFGGTFSITPRATSL